MISTHHSLDCSVGESFCAIWYKALMAFMLNNGGLRSAKMTKQKKEGKSCTKRIQSPVNLPLESDREKGFLFLEVVWIQRNNGGRDLLRMLSFRSTQLNAHQVQYRWSPGTICPLSLRTDPRPWQESLLGPSWVQRNAHKMPKDNIKIYNSSSLL